MKAAHGISNNTLRVGTLSQHCASWHNHLCFDKLAAPSGEMSWALDCHPDCHAEGIACGIRTGWSMMLISTLQGRLMGLKAHLEQAWMTARNSFAKYVSLSNNCMIADPSSIFTREAEMPGDKAAEEGAGVCSVISTHAHTHTRHDIFVNSTQHQGHNRRTRAADRCGIVALAECSLTNIMLQYFKHSSLHEGSPVGQQHASKLPCRFVVSRLTCPAQQGGNKVSYLQRSGNQVACHKNSGWPCV